jgi:hypothetical protein
LIALCEQMGLQHWTAQNLRLIIVPNKLSLILAPLALRRRRRTGSTPLIIILAPLSTSAAATIVAAADPPRNTNSHTNLLRLFIAVVAACEVVLFRTPPFVSCGVSLPAFCLLQIACVSLESFEFVFVNLLVRVGNVLRIIVVA